MSRTSAKRRRWARKQERERSRLIRRIAQLVHEEASKRRGPGGIPGLDGLIPIGWPFCQTGGTMGGRSRDGR